MGNNRGSVDVVVIVESSSTTIINTTVISGSDITTTYSSTLVCEEIVLAVARYIICIPMHFFIISAFFKASVYLCLGRPCSNAVATTIVIITTEPNIFVESSRGQNLIRT
jgi:hypothetical protein